MAGEPAARGRPAEASRFFSDAACLPAGAAHLARDLGAGNASLGALVHSTEHAAALDISNPPTPRHDVPSPPPGRSSSSQGKDRQEEEESGRLVAEAGGAAAADGAAGSGASAEAGGSSRGSAMVRGGGGNARMRGILLQQAPVMVQRPIKKRLALDVRSCPGHEDIFRVLNMVEMNYDYSTPSDSRVSPSAVKLPNPLNRILEAGYHVSFFARLMNSLPREMKEAIDEGMQTLCTLQKLMLAQRSCAASASSAAAAAHDSDAHSSAAPSAAPTVPPGGLWASNKKMCDKARASPVSTCAFSQRGSNGGPAAGAADTDDAAGPATFASSRFNSAGAASSPVPVRPPRGSTRLFSRSLALALAPPSFLGCSRRSPPADAP